MATTSDVPDSQPPSFAGVESVGSGGSTALQATWSAASDDVSPPGQIRYRLYVAETSGGQD